MNVFELAITTVGVIISPLIAVHVQRRLDIARERRLRKMSVFHTLMATRAARISEEHVEALNRIDIEFYVKSTAIASSEGKQDKEVLESWNIYRDHLNIQASQENLLIWGAKSDELFTDLLYQISKSVGYNFSKLDLKRGMYSPVAHRYLEADQQLIREGLVGLLNGDKPLSVSLSVEQLKGISAASNSAHQESKTGFVPPDLSTNVEQIRLNGR